MTKAKAGKTSTLGVLRLMTYIVGISPCLILISGIEILSLLVLPLLFLLFVLIGINFLGGLFLTRKHPDGNTFGPFLLGLLFIVLLVPSGYIGGKVKALKFKYRLPEYEKVIKMVEDGTLDLAGSGIIILPPEYSRLASMVHGDKSDDGMINATFFTGGGFPVKHSGYMYISQGDEAITDEIRRLWPHMQKVKENWYRIAD